MEKATVIIVDDQLTELTVLKKLLSPHYRVLAYKSGEMFLTAIADGLRPDLILLDVIMPKLDGYQTINALRQDSANADIPVIFISALDNLSDEEKGFALGAVDYITKPFNPAIVLSRIRVQIELKRARDDVRQANEELEKKIYDRTRQLFIVNQDLTLLNQQQALMNKELQRANDELQKEIVQREQTELQLKEKNAEIAKAYSELKKAQSQIVQQEKMALIGLLVAGVAHEVNNPMAFVISNLELMKDYFAKLTEFIYQQERALEEMLQIGEKDEKYDQMQAVAAGVHKTKQKMKIEYLIEDGKGLIEETAEGAGRVKNIVQDFKAFSRSDHGESLLDINEGLKKTLNLIKNEIKYKADVELDIGEVPLILGNSGQLNQVFLNLLLNAAQAIEEHGIIRVETRTGEDGIYVVVADTGKGIPVEFADKLFEPFFTTKEPGKGTGLGLSVSYDIVKKHGGELTFESEPGKGAAFKIFLPLEHRRAKEGRSVRDGV